MANGLDDKTMVKLSTPVRSVHIDYSYAGAGDFLHDNLPAEDAAEITCGRWAVINVWRPLYNPISRDPLAVCDARSVPETDLVDVLVMISKRSISQSPKQEPRDQGFQSPVQPCSSVVLCFADDA